MKPRKRMFTLVESLSSNQELGLEPSYEFEFSEIIHHIFLKTDSLPAHLLSIRVFKYSRLFGMNT
ncbi:CLUMA_CG009533, isoform A [Clunio marinus]|uniref:CLUMA_CG009533, isoform A n=1 Tax=Clunio marinus TaxID=568069 RepID=A0A1J1I766_9DIPT|nr:CLUMA_CG009533, isoform A [Clunio marinus]